MIYTGRRNFWRRGCGRIFLNFLNAVYRLKDVRFVCRLRAYCHGWHYCGQNRISTGSTPLGAIASIILCSRSPTFRMMSIERWMELRKCYGGRWSRLRLNSSALFLITAVSCEIGPYWARAWWVFRMIWKFFALGEIWSTKRGLFLRNAIKNLA